MPKVYISGKEIKITYEYQWKKGCIRIHIPKVSVDEKVEIVFEQKLTLNDNHTLERVYDLLNQAQDSNLAKESAYRLLSSGKNLADILGELETTNLKNGGKKQLFIRFIQGVLWIVTEMESETFRGS